MKKLTSAAIAASLSLCSLLPTHAGVTYKSGDNSVKFGGRIQLQYHQEDDSTGTTDDLKFRRFRTYVQGSLHKDWVGKFQTEFGKGKVSLKDAYYKYTGLDYMNVTIGNKNFPFSRELLTSSKKTQLIERSFVGDHNYGTPDRQTGVHLDGSKDLFSWGASLAVASNDPSSSKIDFEPTIQIDKGSDWVDGIMLGGRIEFHPNGKMKISQGDFKKEGFKWYAALGAFTWNNDGDMPNTKNAMDSVTGIELGLGLRSNGWSADLQYNTFSADRETVSTTGTKIHRANQVGADLDSLALEGGYLFSNNKWELTAGYQQQDADAYVEKWTKTTAGVNYFVRKHDIKFQFNYVMGEGKDGSRNSDVDEIIAQAQYVF